MIRYRLSLVQIGVLNFLSRERVRLSTKETEFNTRVCEEFPPKPECCVFIIFLFRWLKFTLKPPYSITHDKLRLAIWDTSFWTFWVKFGHEETLRHILGPILVIIEICQFLMIPWPFEYFSKNGWSQKIKVFSMKE